MRNTCYNVAVSDASGTRGGAGWLVLLHELGARRSSARVAVWRRLRALGAAALPGSAYALPDGAEARESLEWLRGEVESAGGRAVLVTATAVDERAATELERCARETRATLYRELRREAEAVVRVASGSRFRRRRRAGAERQLDGFRRRLRALAAAGGEGDAEARAAESALEALARLLHPEEEEAMRRKSDPTLEAAAYRGRRWVTRPRPGVDRMASAWLIRRFIDPAARFEFAAEPPARSASVPFDMYGVEFGHQGGRCSFEVLADRFGLGARPAIRRLGRLVHAVDLHEPAEDAAEAETVARLVAGLRATHADDHALLEAGIGVFEALHAAAPAERPKGRSPAAPAYIRSGSGTPRRSQRARRPRPKT